MKQIIIPVALLAMLGGCAVVQDVVETGRTYSAHTAAALTQTECSLSTTIRKANADAVSAQLAKEGSPAKFTLDCDGDGSPDF